MKTKCTVLLFLLVCGVLHLGCSPQGDYEFESLTLNQGGLPPWNNVTIKKNGDCSFLHYRSAGEELERYYDTVKLSKSVMADFLGCFNKTRYYQMKDVYKPYGRTIMDGDVWNFTIITSNGEKRIRCDNSMPRSLRHLKKHI